jgi:hypothetical protein
MAEQLGLMCKAARFYAPTHARSDQAGIVRAAAGRHEPAFAAIERVERAGERPARRSNQGSDRALQVPGGADRQGTRGVGEFFSESRAAKYLALQHEQAERAALLSRVPESGARRVLHRLLAIAHGAHDQCVLATGLGDQFEPRAQTAKQARGLGPPREHDGIHPAIHDQWLGRLILDDYQPERPFGNAGGVAQR